MSRFSDKLQFSRKDLQGLHTQVNGGSATGESKSFPLSPPLSEEEQLTRKAAALRLRIEAELKPRFDASEEVLRNIHRQVAALRQQLPPPEFFAFQEQCALLQRRLLLFEETTVQGLLKEAVEAAVVTGACELAHAARWKKSNQWPALSTFVELQLYVLQPMDGPLPATEPSAVNNAVTATTAAIQRQLGVLWSNWQGNPQRPVFMHRFYMLRDVLSGWAGGWCFRPPCAKDDGSRAYPSSCDNGAASSDTVAVRCAWSNWETISALDRLMSFTTLCSQHLREPVVSTLEQLIKNEFADVWAIINSAL
ncbi:hypothetical protein ABL78_1900 [Leptomonas seymouri]|uniref:Uncharacterized protein n=1 Tax=Leptomonas seymouri TaxID=5684 RepID=A0A0N0P7P6_LEPSE|nr:hypothetical protein ABL78_1900 [Leptomonas seymouri]|eukprot:KPI89016.1 hypothetical protein ABL78_1900 [Leptomonas seymouri]